MKNKFEKFLLKNNLSGSNKSSSYLRAIDLLDDLLKRKAPELLVGKESIYKITSVDLIENLYQYILKQQRLDNGIFNNEEPQSYWRNTFYSAALKSFRDFLKSNRLKMDQKTNEFIIPFISWFAKKEGITHNYLKNDFSNSTKQLKEKLIEYEKIYNDEFGSKVFSFDLSNKTEFIRRLEENLYRNEGVFYDFSDRKSNHMPRAILGKRNYLEFLKEFDNSIPVIEKTDFKINDFQQDCESSGLKYSTQIITRYVSSLVTKPFVLLSGLSGSGKTKLAQSFAQWISKSKDQYCIVPVGADWTNREPLLGYVNALEPKEYVLSENGALELIIKANKNPTKPYFLILDEMNLSHVERYFADFLSVMESNDTFKLHSSDANLNLGKTNEVPSELSWPKNLFVVGTVNIDETTYMFSPKVLDRANVIEFRVSNTEIGDFLNEAQEITSVEKMGASMGDSLVTIAKNKEARIDVDFDKLNTELLNFFDELQPLGAEFGYRTASEIQTLFAKINLVNPEYKDNVDEKIDIAIMQKLLPKLHGSRRKLLKTLNLLAQKCLVEKQEKIFNERGEYSIDDGNKVIYNLSFEKISRMYKNAIENGFASYAEA